MRSTPGTSVGEAGRWSVGRRVAYWTVVASLLALHLGLGLDSARRKSATYDEAAHLTAGVSYWLFNDYRLNPENGNLPQRWFGLSAILSGAKFPADEDAWRKGDVWRLSDAFMYDDPAVRDQRLFRGRLFAMALSLALCLVVFGWSHELFGAIGGLISLALCALSPTILAHGRLMTSDVCVSLFLTLSTWRVWTCLHRLTPFQAAACAASVACLFLSKATAALIVPVTVVMLAVRLAFGFPLEIRWGRSHHHLRSRWRQLGVAAAMGLLCMVVAWGSVWAAHGFRHRAAPAGVEYQYLEVSIEGPLRFLQRDTAAMIRLLDRSHLLPESYVYGLAFVLAHSERNAFLAGQYSVDGWWEFFPTMVGAKTPLPLFFLLALALAWIARQTWRRWRPAADAADEESADARPALLYQITPLLAIWIVVWPVLLNSSLNIGHRHALPLYPPAMILTGGVAMALQSRWWAMRLLPLAALIWFGAETARAHPDYLAYFNTCYPRNQAYRLAVDSSLDWGQDLPALADWLRKNADDETPVYLSYFGASRPAEYGIEATRLRISDEAARPWPATLDLGLHAGIYCISATHLQAVYNQLSGAWDETDEEHYQEAIGRYNALLKEHGRDRLRERLEEGDLELAAVLHDRELYASARLLAYLKNREPTAEAGYSILIYRVSPREIHEALFGPAPYPAIRP